MKLAWDGEAACGPEAAAEPLPPSARAPQVSLNDGILGSQLSGNKIAWTARKGFADVSCSVAAKSAGSVNCASGTDN